MKQVHSKGTIGDLTTPLFTDATHVSTSINGADKNIYDHTFIYIGIIVIYSESIYTQLNINNMSNIILKADEAFDMNALKAEFEKTPPRSFQALAIDAPRMTNPRLKGVLPQRCINVTFEPLSDERNRYRGSGTKARIVCLFENTNRSAFLKAVELYEKIAKVEDLLAKRNLAMQFVQDDVRQFNFESKREYTPRDSRRINTTTNTAEEMLDPRTGKPIVTKNHSFFVFSDDILVRVVTGHVRAIDTWKEASSADESFDPDTKETVDSAIEEELKSAQNVAK